LWEDGPDRPIGGLRFPPSSLDSKPANKNPLLMLGTVEWHNGVSIWLFHDRKTAKVVAANLTSRSFRRALVLADQASFGALGRQPAI
jgi:hypothetical protein